MVANPAILPCGPQNPLVVGQSEDSRYVENIMEHALLSDVLQHCWYVENLRVEVMRPEVDGGGYDLVLEAKRPGRKRGRVRHVQLKSRWRHGGRRTIKNLNSRLRDHPDPCVVWIFWQVDPATCRVTLQYRYSPMSKWPNPVPGASKFNLAWQDFIPGPGAGFLNTRGLASNLF